MLGPEPAIGAPEEEDAEEDGPPEAGEAVLYVSAEESVEQVLHCPCISPDVMQSTHMSQCSSHMHSRNI